jgi:hypothetical protein
MDSICLFINALDFWSAGLLFLNWADHQAPLTRYSPLFVVELHNRQIQ